jgi:TPR repeat protein
MPQKWQYYHDIGFVYYWRLRDYQSAALWFQRAAAQPNAPNWLTPLAASMLTRGNDRAAARFLWQQIAKSEEAWLRRSAERSLLQLQALDQIDQLEAIVRKYPVPSGEPHTWSSLMKRGVLPGQPVDPVGTPYILDPATGRVRVSEQSPLYPMPEEPRPVQ